MIQLSWPLIDTQSIQEVVVGEAAEDVQYHDDTIIYWDNNQILEDTLPYHEDSDNDFGNEMSILIFFFYMNSTIKHICDYM